MVFLDFTAFHRGYGWRMSFPQIVVMSMFAVGTSHAEIDAQAIALNCRNCHAASASAVPALEPLSPENISQMLLDFKYDRKPATLMPRIAKGYSDEELKAVADYLGRR